MDNHATSPIFISVTITYQNGLLNSYINIKIYLNLPVPLDIFQTWILHPTIDGIDVDKCRKLELNQLLE